MSIRNAVVAAAVLATVACQAPRSPGQQQQTQDPKAPVARIGGQTVTAAELDESVQGELAQLEQQYQEQRYQIRRGALEAMLRRRAFDAKAKAQGLGTADELVEKEIMSKIPDPPDAEIKALYDRAVAGGQQLPPLETLKGDIARFIKNQQAQGPLVQYYEGLKKEMGIEVLLPPYKTPKVAVDATGPSKGPAGAPVTIVEFSDFECPYCVRAEASVKEVMDAYPGKIRLVYRDFPLPMHKHAPDAAEAAHCAGDQGKYWEMHAKLFANAAKLEVADLKAYARDVGLDGGKFDQCLDSNEKAKTVEMHKKAGAALGVTGTPAFFINGRQLSGAQPPEAFKAIIDEELQAK